MASRLVYLSAILLILLVWCGPLKSDEPSAATKDQTQSEGDAQEARAPASTDATSVQGKQDFTKDYLDKVNAAQQAADEQSAQDRARHDKLLEYYMKH